MQTITDDLIYYNDTTMILLLFRSLCVDFHLPGLGD
jgi:hypothetical protein